MSDSPDAPVKKVEDVSQGSQVIFVLGGPGAGKGTQCQLVAEHMQQVYHLSVGDVLRAEMNTSGSPYSEIIRQNMQEGRVGPKEITVELIGKALRERTFAQERCSIFLLDGFPRKMDQARLFEETVQAPDRVIVLNCSTDLLQKRLQTRAATDKSRFDDEVSIIQKRLNTFSNDVSEVIGHYSNQQKLTHVDADGNVEEVSQAFLRAVKDALVPKAPGM